MRESNSRPRITKPMFYHLTNRANLAESRGVEPHPISENPVFKAGRRTNAAALLSKIFGGDKWYRSTLLGL